MVACEHCLLLTNAVPVQGLGAQLLPRWYLPILAAMHVHVTEFKLFKHIINNLALLEPFAHLQFLVAEDPVVTEGFHKHPWPHHLSNPVASISTHQHRRVVVSNRKMLYQTAFTHGKEITCLLLGWARSKEIQAGERFIRVPVFLIQASDPAAFVKGMVPREHRRRTGHRPHPSFTYRFPVKKKLSLWWLETEIYVMIEMICNSWVFDMSIDSKCCESSRLKKKRSFQAAWLVWWWTFSSLSALEIIE